MAKNIRQAITTISAPPIGLDWLQSPFNVSLGVDLSQAMGVTYTVQYCLSDLNDSTVTSPLWRADTTLGTNQTTSGTTQYTTPIMFVRVNVTAISSGTVYVEVVQGMSAR
jgi:hypothetical protein